MHDYFFKKLGIASIAEKIALCSSLMVSIVLVIAASGKLLYPSEHSKMFDQCIGGFEVLFLVAIIIFRLRWQMWAVAAVIFAAWSGYAFYWYFLELPCSCMGSKLHIPTGYSLSFDIFFFFAGLMIGYLLKGAVNWIYFCVLAGLMAALVGYAFADSVYSNLVLGL